VADPETAREFHDGALPKKALSLDEDYRERSSPPL